LLDGKDNPIIMIRYLTGTIIDLEKVSLTIDVGGVGYHLFTPGTVRNVCILGKECSLFIQTIVREDAFALYGFLTKDERELFSLLLSVNRVGPKAALEMMELPLDKLTKAISQKDSVFIASVPGIGKKTAERIVLDLHDKVVQHDEHETSLYKEDKFISDEIIEALTAMGYTQRHVTNVLKRLPKGVSEDAAVITFFLQNV
jgi:holliday junction DNA helicase RuvA